MKQCRKCLESKPLSEFWKHTSTKDNYYNTCKNCTRVQRKEWAKKRTELFDASCIPVTKVCNDCGVDKPAKEFTIRRRKLDGLTNICTECEKLRRGSTYSHIPWEDRVPKDKRCRKCDETKPYKDFHKNTKRRDGLSDYCKPCSYIEQSRIKFGVSKDWIKEHMAKGCAVCGSMENLHIDHCHTTGKARGVLCKGCNHAEGNLQGSPERARALADYMERFLSL